MVAKLECPAYRSLNEKYPSNVIHVHTHSSPTSVPSPAETIREKQWRTGKKSSASQNRLNHEHCSYEGDTSAFKNELQEVELECDYDKNVTELYALLESSDWQRARNRCRTHSEEIRQWIVRIDQNQQLRWRLLPLHAAIIFQAPSSLVSSLLKRYPVAATRKDDQGMLPLHLAFRHKKKDGDNNDDDDDVLALLLAHYPEATLVRDHRDRIPLDHGRECRFSSDLLRRYSEAAVTVSSAGTCSTSSHNTISEGTGTTCSGSRLQEEYEAKISCIRAGYECKLQSQKDKHVNQIKLLQQKLNDAAQQARLDATDNHQQLIEHYEEEIIQLREQLSRQVNKNRATSEFLNQHIDFLTTSNQDIRQQNETFTEKYNAIIRDNEELRDILANVYEQQDMIQELARKQHEYVNTSRALRTEMLQELLKQEERIDHSDTLKGTLLIELAASVQNQIHGYMEIRAHHECDHDLAFLRENIPRDTRQDAKCTQDIMSTELSSANRIDVDRGMDTLTVSDNRGQTNVEAIYCVSIKDPEESPFSVPDHRDAIDIEAFTFAKSEEDFDEVRILVDEVSTITEYSAY